MRPLLRLSLSALCAARFLAGAAIATGETPLSAWSMETFVSKALERSAALIEADEILRLKEIAYGKRIFPLSMSVSSETALVYTLPPKTYGSTWTTASGGLAKGFYPTETLRLNLPLLPQLTLGASYRILDPDGAVIGLNLKPFYRDAATENARLEYEAQRLENLAIRKRTELDARKLYIAAIVADGERDLAARSLANAEAALKVTELRQAEELVGDEELSAGRMALYDAKLRFVRARKAAGDARTGLTRLVGDDFSASLLVDVAGAPPAPDDASYVSRAAAASDPLLKQLSLRLAAAGTALARARLGFQNVGFSLSATVPGLGAQAALSLGLAFPLSLPGEIEAASIAVKQAERAIENRRRALADAAADVLADLEIASLTLGIRAEEKGEAARRYAAALIRFDAGEMLATALEAAEIGRDRADAAYEAARLAVWAAWYALQSLISD